jgi:hypothetical protein
MEEVACLEISAANVPRGDYPNTDIDSADLHVYTGYGDYMDYIDNTDCYFNHDRVDYGDLAGCDDNCVWLAKGWPNSDMPERAVIGKNAPTGRFLIVIHNLYSTTMVGPAPITPTVRVFANRVSLYEGSAMIDNLEAWLVGELVGPPWTFDPISNEDGAPLIVPNGALIQQ